MSSKKNLGSYLESLGTITVVVLVAALVSVLAVVSLFFTSDMNLSNSVSENITFLKDNVFVNLLVMALAIGILFMLRPRIEKVPIRIWKICLMAWTIGFGLLWVFSSLSAPTFDSQVVTEAGEACAKGDYSNLTHVYFQKYPFQLGYVLFSELILRIFPIDGFYLTISAVNILLLAVAYWAILRFVEEQFSNDSVTRLTALLLLFCLQPILFSTFLYGTIPGLAMALWAATHTVLYLKTKSIKHAVLACVFVSLAVLLKQNYLIVLIAMIAVLLLAFIGKPNWRTLVVIGMAVIFTFGLRSAVTLQYEKRADVTFGSGIPITAWAAMGLGDGYTTAGWYNNHFSKAFEQQGGKTDQLSADINAEIKKRISAMEEDKPMAATFFTKKVLSQWNEPTYQSIWTNQVRATYGGRWGIASLLCGAGEGATKAYMGAYQQLILLCAAIALWQCVRKKKASFALIPLIILGGFLYHLVFEAKSQYILPYFVLMIPYAAYGLNTLFVKLTARFTRHKKLEPPMQVSEAQEVTTV